MQFIKDAFIKETKALNNFEALYEPIDLNDRQSDTSVGKFPGPQYSTLNKYVVANEDKKL